MLVEQVVGHALLGVEQHVVGLGAQECRVQQADQLDRGTVGKAQSGAQFGTLGVDAVVLADLLLGPGHLREDRLRAVRRRQVHVAVPAGQADQDLQRLVRARPDDPRRAFRVGVQHRAVGALEVRAAGVVARDHLQRSAGGQADRFDVAVGGTVQVEVEGERCQFGEMPVLPEQPQGVIGHVTERNSRH
ncbi:hypothetical protein O1M54_12380 [Streptomyces diastatochromogenes]|nr:hypothetical protein [Streptomyces diastatochromogenes]